MRRSMGRRGNNAGGPLITGHLEDIDLELELLKRKREMIEQQQHLLVMEQQFKSSRHYDSYDQMRYDEPVQHGSNRDFTQLYDSGLNNRNQFGRKRQPEVQWQYEGSSKRTHAKKKNNQSQFNQQGQGNIGPANIRNQRPVPGPNQGPKSSLKGPAPLMDIKVKPSVGQKIANQKPSQKTSNRAFTLTKAFKPKAPPAPNKLASKTPAERKSLVAAAKESGVVLRMLLPDRVPTQQVSGRLELALGAIMKNIRGLIPSDSPHAAAIRSVHLQRVMKQAVRERIRTVMLGKVVGSLTDILAIYREEFPEATDIDIVNIALEAGDAPGVQGHPAKEREEKPKLIQSVAAEAESFKRNMNLVLKAKLNEMFDKLQEIYGSTPAQTELNSGTPEDQNEPQINGEIKKDQEEPSENQEFLNTNIKVRDVKRILPRLMKKCIPYIIKLIDVVPVSQIATEAGVTLRVNPKAATIFSNNVSGEEQGDAEKIVMSSGASSEARQAYNLPYYVKVMGRPTLPKRKVMQTFLGQFNPKSIKKHRNIHNLLFVGFTEKTDFDAMVGADGTVVGRSTLSVRVCSKGAQDTTNGQNGENNDTNFAMDINPDEIKKENPKDGEIITADLDFQITDLLSSIRKSEEEEADGTVQETGEEIDDNSKVVETEVVAEQNEDESKENKNEQGKEDTQNDEEMENDNADAADSQDNATETVDNEDAIMSTTEETTGDENTAAEEKEVPDEAETQSSELANDPETQNSEAINEASIENAETTNETDKTEVTDNTQTENSTESNNIETNPKVTDNEGTQPSEDSPTKTGDPCEGDKVGDLKSNTSGRSTPMRTSARLASGTPSTIRTRRASRLAQN